VLYSLIDAPPLRIAEVHRLAPGLMFEHATLPSGHSASSPDPAQRATDHVLAFTHGPCIAESTDLLTMDGRSLRLELDSENERRFCRYFRETPTRLHLCIAVRRGPAVPIETYVAICEGQIADKPAGPDELGWDRLFVPAGHRETLAQLVERGVAAGPRPEAYAAAARALLGS
jgi:hypothetical protein